MAEKFGIHPDTGRWNALHAQQFMGEHVKRIMDMYKQATPEFIEGGHNWYEKAHDIAKGIGRGDVEKGAGIIAALSPQTGWGRNIQLAGEMARTGNARHTTDSVTKAQRILEGEHPLNVLGGQKVTSFYKNIVDPSDREPVTIDRHAHDIPMGITFRGSKKSDEPSPDLGLSEKGRYNHFVDAYKKAAEHLEVDVPHKVQATTWVTHRGAIG